MLRSVDHLEAVKKIANDRLARAIVYLVMNNVPLEIAEKLNAIELEAWCIIMGEIKGAKYNWELGCWRDQDEEDFDDASIG